MIETNKDYLELLGDLRQAYLNARQHKTGKGSCIRCAIDIEEELDTLAHSIVDGSYTIRPSVCFLVTSPVLREIIAAEFRDRIVHHYVFNYLNPHLERELITDCYSCRQNKGTSFGVDRLDYHIRSCSQNYTRACWVLQLDISGYFMAIDRRRLCRMALALMDRIGRKRDKKGRLLNSYARHGFVSQLLPIIIMHDPLINCDVRDWNGLYDKLPRSKSLRYSAPDCGLPIGNLTSQMFSNLYMNGFDQWVKRVLKVKHYGRYVDDSFYLSCDRDWLLSLIQPVDDYLQRELGIHLNRKKTKLTEVKLGVSFLGTHLKPYRRYMRNDTLMRIREQIDFMKGVPYRKLRHDVTRARLLASANSFLGVMIHTSSFHIAQRLFGSYPMFMFADATRGMKKFKMNTEKIQLLR